MRNAFDVLWNDTNKEMQMFTGMLFELRGIAEASLRLQAIVVGDSAARAWRSVLVFDTLLMCARVSQVNLWVPSLSSFSSLLCSSSVPLLQSGARPRLGCGATHVSGEQ